MNPTEKCKACKFRSIIQDGRCEVSVFRKCIKPIEVKPCVCDMRLVLSRGCQCGGR